MTNLCASTEYVTKSTIAINHAFGPHLVLPSLQLPMSPFITVGKGSQVYTPFMNVAQNRLLTVMCCAFVRVMRSIDLYIIASTFILCVM